MVKCTEDNTGFSNLINTIIIAVIYIYIYTFILFTFIHWILCLFLFTRGVQNSFIYGENQETAKSLALTRPFKNTLL